MTPSIICKVSFQRDSRKKTNSCFRYVHFFHQSFYVTRRDEMGRMAHATETELLALREKGNASFSTNTK